MADQTPDPIDVANDQAPDAIAALAREMDEAHHRADRFIRRDESGLTAETDPIDLIADLSELLHLGSTMLASPAVDDATRQERPGLTPEWLTRMAIACRNVQEQAQPKNVEWFDWVPERLDRAAAYLGRTDK